MNNQNEILKIISENLGIDTTQDVAFVKVEDLIKIFKVGQAYGTPRIEEYLEIMQKNSAYVESALFTLNVFQSRLDFANIGSAKTASDNMKNYKPLSIDLTKEQLENLSSNYKEILTRALDIHKEHTQKRKEAMEQLSAMEKELLLKIQNSNNPK